MSILGKRGYALAEKTLGIGEKNKRGGEETKMIHIHTETDRHIHTYAHTQASVFYRRRWISLSNVLIGTAGHCQ
jgi:hypothetical protein